MRTNPTDMLRGKERKKRKNRHAKLDRGGWRRFMHTKVHGGLPSMGPHRVRHDWSDLAAAAAAAAAICQRIRKTQEWPQDQFSFSLQKKAMPKNIQTTTQLHSSHTLANNAQNSPSQASTVCEPWTFRCSSWI